MEAKYGRVFTETEVLSLIQGAYRMACSDEGNPQSDIAEAPSLLEVLAYTRQRLTFPADEPVFVLRGQDLVARAGLYGYDEGCSDLGLDSRSLHRQGLSAVIREFETFQDEHPERTKVPD